MAVTIDPRVSYFGDRIIVTGTYGTDSADTSIDLSSIVSEIDAAVLTPTAVPADFTTSLGPPPLTAKVTDFARINGTTLEIVTGNDSGTPQTAGTFLVIGRR